jgi:protein-disulfide isomerase
MNRKWPVLAAIAAVIVAFVAGALVYKERSRQAATRAVESSAEALIRPHSPVYGNPSARVTIVEFFDPSCETCRAFYPIVKGMINASFGQVRLVVRYAPLHEGSDTAVKILEAARKQGKYWEAVERALADQPRWAAHHNPNPELIWESIADIGLDVPRAKADAESPAIAALLRQDVADMKALNVSATPGFFVNGKPLLDFGDVQLKALVDKEIATTKSR